MVGSSATAAAAITEDCDVGLYMCDRPLVPNSDTTDEEMDGSDMEVDSSKGVKQVRRGGSQSNNSSNGGGPETLKETHHWRRRAPLLPQRMAKLVSRVSGATRLSLEITALFWEAIFDTISESTNSGVWLGTAAWEEVRCVGLAAASVLSPLSSLNPRIVSRLVGSTTAAGYSVVNQSLTATEALLEGGFSLYTRAVNMGLYAAGEYVRLIDALFGATDTSRVLASFMHMCKREAFEKNPEIRALVDEHGVVGFGSQVVKTIVAWICLQAVTHGRTRPYRMHLLHSNTQAGAAAFCPRKFIDSSGKPLPDRSRTPDARTPLTPRASHGAEAATAGDNNNNNNNNNNNDDDDDDDDNDNDAYYALSDQEGSSHADPDWDRRLMEALRKLSLKRSVPDGDDDDGGAPEARPSLWSTLRTVRESAAATAQKEGMSLLDGSPSDSDAGGPPQPRGRRASVPFESAPASLISSPQFAVTPSGDPDSLHVPLLDGLPPAAGSECVSPWLLQEFPRKPLLFNLARFIPVASSAYGHSFMQVLGLRHGMVDARALIDAFGDYEVGHRGLSQSNSTASMDQAATPGLLHARSPSAAKLPRAQPMSSYHTHSAYNASRPESQRQYERRHFRSPSNRRPPPVRRHRRRRPVSEHPNHFCFSQHTAIPLGDLLFSSYVPPIVPGVTNAASAQADAVDRRLRLRAKRQQQQPDKEKELRAAPAPARGWIASIYHSLPSPLEVLSAVPVIPGLVSRMLTVTTPSSPPPPPTPPRHEPTPGQFRRFDKLRQRLVYRNPSIHALVHYIAVDHATRSIVLACRGTLGISDLFIDMICEYETIHLPDHCGKPGEEIKPTDFRVHSGMWHSALLLADPSSEVFKEVAEALRLYPEYGLVVTGHSLGGGVASLLTLLWSQPMFLGPPSTTPAAGSMTPGLAHGSVRQFVTTEKFGLVSQRPIHCFSYGSPCSTNAALSYYCRGLVTSVANANDVVSFLSIGTCVDILNISAVLGRERGVAEKVVRRFFATQRNKIGKKLNWFDFDFSKLRAYARDDEQDEESEVEEDEDDELQPKSKRRKRSDDPSSLDDWHWSLVKTLRANMDSEKLYPPGDVFILAAPGDDEMSDAQLKSPDDDTNVPPVAAEGDVADDHLAVGLFYCPDVAERFSELRFTRNMLSHHLPSTYERRLAALVHEMKK
ncbi:hypothetical protein GGI20_005907 [Coemansia sp. BCRC 34301]|nr:hypothetical protein GGI20_005907 [Coemansia sp. BCRC 34301]